MADLENNLRDFIDVILEENKIKTKYININQISTGGANYSSALYTVTVETDDEDIEMFAKVGTMSREIRQVMNGDWMYETERIVYETLAPEYDDLQSKHGVPEEHRFVFPKCYGINRKPGQETFVLENLTPEGYTSYSRFDSMDWEHAAVSMEMLAKFHALSFAYERENPEEFKKLSDRMVKQEGTTAERIQSEHIRSLWVSMVERALNVIDAVHRDKVRDLLMQEDFLKKYKAPIDKPVLVHGDYRLSNILFRRKGGCLQAIPVDYQRVQLGCPANDLLYFIFTGSDEDFRREHFDRLLDHYYEHLCQAMERLHVDPVEAYPRETFDDHMKKALPYLLFLGVALLPMILVETEAAPRMDGDADLSTFLIEPNSLYKARFRGLVRDIARWD